MTPKDVTVKDGKIFIKEGYFYFQGKQYEIKNTEIVTNDNNKNENSESIPF